MLPSLVVSFGLFAVATAQHPGIVPEVHPRLVTWHCTKSRGCVPRNLAVVLESSKRNVYQVDNPGYTCGSQGSAPNTTACSSLEDCQKNCEMQGVSDYSTVGVRTDGASIQLTQLSSNLTKLSPRVYLLSEDEQNYEMFSLLDQELSFDVDATKLPCGMNGALYLIEMEKYGGKDSINTGGAYYGTGYCDAQCYIYPFINGKGNIGGLGSCCNELDIWEANDRATQLAPHSCNITGLYECNGGECKKGGVCDHSGCGYNPYGIGNKTYYGLGMTVDTSRPFTVVTQFPAKNGVLSEIRRLYIQDGIVIQNAAVAKTDRTAVNYINDGYCEEAGASEYLRLGGTPIMGEAMSRGLVLSMSVWWDNSTFMNWLDANSAGPCSTTEGMPTAIIQSQPDSAVTFSNIKWGDINSTITHWKKGYGHGHGHGHGYGGHR